MRNQQTTYYIPALAPIYDRLDDLAWPLIRIMFGLFFIPDGCLKLFGWWAWAGNVEATGAFMDKIGISPGLFWAYYVGVLCLVGGILIVVGLFTRPVAILFAGFLFVATFYVHWSFGFFWQKVGWSVPLLLFVLAIALVIRGSGPCSLDRKFGREF